MTKSTYASLAILLSKLIAQLFTESSELISYNYLLGEINKWIKGALTPSLHPAPTIEGEN